MAWHFLHRMMLQTLAHIAPSSCLFKARTASVQTSRCLPSNNRCCASVDWSKECRLPWKLPPRGLDGCPPTKSPTKLSEGWTFWKVLRVTRLHATAASAPCLRIRGIYLPRRSRMFSKSSLSFEVASDEKPQN